MQYAVDKNQAEIKIYDLALDFYVNDMSFTLVINPIIRILSASQVLYYDMQNQTFNLTLHETASSLPLISNGYESEFDGIILNRTYA